MLGLRRSKYPMTLTGQQGGGAMSNTGKIDNSNKQCNVMTDHCFLFQPLSIGHGCYTFHFLFFMESYKTHTLPTMPC